MGRERTRHPAARLGAGGISGDDRDRVGLATGTALGGEAGGGVGGNAEAQKKLYAVSPSGTLRGNVPGNVPGGAVTGGCDRLATPGAGGFRHPRSTLQSGHEGD